ncbi:hypothetical protein BAE44_0025325 [Dichanthelium oligosanthes]|uniref:Uncharacterized protein n=1 Tax=Dichanthelium oligosanthes TaxID=888268 RepID=A0A1E5ULA7_9POAL|nr:hypothetical protein BAE44_0025325 [Dichanthelium oligosanthes]
MAPVRIIDVSYVVAAPSVVADVPPPEPIEINTMEAQWVGLPLLQHLLFFEGDQIPPFDADLRSLKSTTPPLPRHWPPMPRSPASSTTSRPPATWPSCGRRPPAPKASSSTHVPEGVALDEDVFLFFFADVRQRLDPPAGADNFGACITACLARLPARELHAEGALAAAAAAAVQGAVDELAEDPLGA